MDESAYGYSYSIQGRNLATGQDFTVAAGPAPCLRLDGHAKPDALERKRSVIRGLLSLGH